MGIVNKYRFWVTLDNYHTFTINIHAEDSQEAVRRLNENVSDVKEFEILNVKYNVKRETGNE